MRRLLAVALLACAIAAPTVTEATVLRSFTMAELVSEADVVAVAEIRATRALRGGTRNFIYTDYTLRLDEVWRSVRRAAGAAAPTRELVLRQIGGRMGDVEQSVVGTADLRVGDRVVVFARFDGERAYLVGMHQGSYFVHGSGAAATARRAREVTPNAAPAPTLSELRADVKRHAAQAAAVKPGASPTGGATVGGAR